MEQVGHHPNHRDSMMQASISPTGQTAMHHLVELESDCRFEYDRENTEILKPFSCSHGYLMTLFHPQNSKSNIVQHSRKHSRRAFRMKAPTTIIVLIPADPSRHFYCPRLRNVLLRDVKRKNNPWEKKARTSIAGRPMAVILLEFLIKGQTVACRVFE